MKAAMVRMLDRGVLGLVAALAAGCTGPDPTPEELELELALEAEELELELVSIPVQAEREAEPPAPEREAEAVRAPVERPRVRVQSGPACADGYDDDCLRGIGSCPFSITYEGFPALSADGSEVVTFEQSIASGADEDVGTYDVVWRRVEDDAELRRMRLADGGRIGGDTEEEYDRECRRAAREARRAVARASEELREGWASLPELAVQGAAPMWVAYDEEFDERTSPVPAAERPVEAFHRNGWFIVRVPGVKVLHKEARTDWLGLPPELTMDSTVPNIRALHGDPATGVTVVRMDYESASCMSDTSPVFHVVTLPLEAFEVIEQRAAYVERYDVEDG